LPTADGVERGDAGENGIAGGEFCHIEVHARTCAAPHVEEVSRLADAVVARHAARR
jgi:hypothetical protein